LLIQILLYLYIRCAALRSITLIDGDKLIDLLIRHGIGVRKKTVEVLEVVAEDFAAADEGE
jgi:restriction endonuclease Mrr